MSACSRAVCSSGCSRASTLPAIRPTRAIPILALVPADRRDTLLAKADPKAPNVFRFDIRLQGANETVFFDA